MRAVYRWRVKPGDEETFTKAWAQATKTIRSKVKGARGSMLLRSLRDPAEFMATARWDSFQDWQAFTQSDPADPEAFRVMSAASQMLSAEVFDEVEDLLDYQQ
ncbi:MAG: antibiotic biosynthesis monooxygenase [Chloroflexi bacterium]|nr:antibiotic biosynthesis monooxygenase [Chloroflexota bacterium]